MNPIDPPRLHGETLGKAQFKSRPEDFRVEEVLGWKPSGEGEHCFLWIEKSGCNSNEVAAVIADRLGIRKRLISHCGLKDKHAITRQWFSIHLPGTKSPTASELETDNFRVLDITRNSRKLRRGTHRGNRFTIRLCDCQFTPAELETRWSQIVARGAPNYFGPQRFGQSGGNIQQALRLALGESVIRDRLVRGILNLFAAQLPIQRLRRRASPERNVGPTLVWRSLRIPKQPQHNFSQKPNWRRTEPIPTRATGTHFATLGFRRSSQRRTGCRMRNFSRGSLPRNPNGSRGLWTATTTPSNSSHPLPCQTSMGIPHHTTITVRAPQRHLRHRDHKRINQNIKTEPTDKNRQSPRFYNFQ